MFIVSYLQATARLTNVAVIARTSDLVNSIIQQILRLQVFVIIYNLAPKMTRFKLHKDSLHESRFVNSFRNNLLRSELNYHRRNVAQLTQDISNLEAKIYGNAFSFFTKIRIKAFIKKLALTRKICGILSKKVQKLALLKLLSNLSVKTTVFCFFLISHKFYRFRLVVDINITT